MSKVLIIQDLGFVAKRLLMILETHFNTTLAETSDSAHKLLDTNEYDALFVGITNEGSQGIEFIKSLQAKKGQDFKVFALESGVSTLPRIQALSVGVRDVLHEEMHQDEILLRIKNQINIQGKREVKHNDLKISIPNLTAYRNTEKLDLTLIEFKILLYLMKNAGTIVSRDDLKLFTWPDHIVQDKTINTHLTNLRIKLDKSVSRIKSVKGEGIILI